MRKLENRTEENLEKRIRQTNGRGKWRKVN